MLFYIFLTLFSISLIFMVLGYFINFPVLSLFGAFILFGLGLVMLGTDIELKTGDVTDINYNGTTATSLETSYNYETYDFGSIGTTNISIFFAIIGAFTFILFIFRLGD